MYVGINKKASKVVSVFINLSSSSGPNVAAKAWSRLLVSCLCAVSHFTEAEKPLPGKKAVSTPAAGSCHLLDYCCLLCPPLVNGVLS